MSEKNMRILIVDDEIDIRSTIGEALTLEGYGEVLKARDGEEAISILEGHEIDLIISDIRMPKVTGIELLKHVREHYNNTSFVLMTAYSDIMDVKKAIESGANGFLKKPFSLGKLIEELDKVVGPANDHRDNNNEFVFNIAKDDSGLDLHPVPLEQSHLIAPYEAPVYIKLTDGKIIMFASRFFALDQYRIDQLKSEGINNFYVHREVIENINEDRKKVANHD